jgi:hypothetical protein
MRLVISIAGSVSKEFHTMPKGIEYRILERYVDGRWATFAVAYRRGGQFVLFAPPWRAHRELPVSSLEDLNSAQFPSSAHAHRWSAVRTCEDGVRHPLQLLKRNVSPLDCAVVRRLLSAFVRGDLGAEQRGCLEGHIDQCDACASAMGQQIAEDIAAGAIPQPAKVRRESTAVKRWGARSAVTWHGHRVAAPVLRSWGYHRVLQSAGLRRGVAMSGAEEDAVRIQVLDPSLGLVAGEVVRAAVIELPYFTKEGAFRMTLWLEDADAERYRGYAAVCVLKLDGVGLAFEAQVGGPDVTFLGAELPPLDGESAVLPADAFDYFLAPAPQPGSGV